MDQLFNRKYIIQGLFVLLALILLGRLFYIQVASDKYFLDANNNALRKKFIYPARGVITDRKGKVLAQNQPTYDLMVTPNEVLPFDTLSLCNVIGITMEDFRKKFHKAVVQSRYQSSIFQKLLSVQTYAMLQERMANYKGFEVQKRTIRYYPDSIGGQLLGYIKEVSQAEIERHHGYYKPGDYIGKSGIERQYETDLRGTKGVRNMLYNVRNVAQGSYADGKFDSLAIAGEQLTTTIDVEIQKLGEQLLNNKVGSIVAIEPATGEVLAFVSSPGYDPNLMVGSESGNNYMKIFSNPYRPFFIRPIKGRYSPGSAFKPLSALIALQEGLVNENTTFNCPGYYQVGKTRFKCEHVDGNIALRRGIARSCNTYFWNLFVKEMTKKGRKNQHKAYDEWQEKVRKFGIGDTLGIDYPGERGYKLFTAEDYTQRYSKYWSYGTILSVGIGQGEITTTPLQMANIMAIIANKGYYIKPHLVKGIGNDKHIDPKYKEKHYVGVDAKHFGPVIDGMQDAVNSPIGTARESMIPNILMCGKTGTVQNTHGKNHSVFIGFAPRDNPKIAIAVIVENGGYGGAYAAPIASFITEKYLTDSLKGRRINGATIEQYKADNLLPVLKDKLPKQKPKVDTSKVDTAKKTVPLKTAVATNQFNKTAVAPKNNAATE
ncbi:penicillin-binding protein 2 [Pedobacter ureilyticus]|uniref:Penicillin-binding protein 2 n=1 Tax=Pedobacter ureilyticus TaxID=1393051 RepID=A0ABW9JAH8_9SPHI|nr:penicillin-binding protein 2 [Pedobacter helvus]